MRLFKTILICAAALLITSCMVDATSSGSNSTTSGLSAGTSTDYNSSSTVDTATYSKVIYLNLTDGTASDDNSTWTEIGIGSDYAITFFDEFI